jgi:hypothetical protein
MLFISFSIVALSLVNVSPTPNGTSESEASAVPWILRIEFFNLAYFMFQAVSAARLGLPEKVSISLYFSSSESDWS